MGDIFITILSLIGIICIVLLPIILWGYGFSLLVKEDFHRTRFLVGLGTGIFIAGVSFFRPIIENYPIAGAFFLFLLLIGIAFLIYEVISLLRSGKVHFPENREWKVWVAHSGVFAIIIGASMVFSPDSMVAPVLASYFGYLIAASIEESSKHIGYIGSDASPVRSREYMFLLTFFVVLGFVSIENILYLYAYVEKGVPISDFVRLWMMRSFFSLIAHMFVSFIITFAYFRAMNYSFASVPYLSFFCLGTLCAIGGHTLYNNYIYHDNVIGILIFTLVALFGMSYMMYGAKDYTISRL